jgi:hypothetical protein
VEVEREVKEAESKPTLHSMPSRLLCEVLETQEVVLKMLNCFGAAATL